MTFGIVSNSAYRSGCLFRVIRDGCSPALDGRNVASYPKADMAPMPRDGSLAPPDLVGKLDVLRVEFEKWATETWEEKQ